MKTKYRIVQNGVDKFFFQMKHTYFGKWMRHWKEYDNLNAAEEGLQEYKELRKEEEKKYKLDKTIVNKFYR